MMKPPRLMVLSCLLAAATFCRGEMAPETIFKNGTLEDSGKDWALSKGATVAEEDGNHFLRLQAEGPNEQIQAYQKAALPAGSQSVTISFRVRYSDLKPGAENWHTGRIVMHFKSATDEMLKPDPKPFAFKGDSNGWVDVQRAINVPEGAVVLEFMPALFQVATGTLDIDDISVVPSQDPAAP